MRHYPIFYKLFLLVITVVFFQPIISRGVNELDPVLSYEVTVMQNGIENRNANYRIPVLAIGPINRTLFVAVEERLGGNGDYNPKNIAYKYSEDNGITWSKLGIIFESSDSGNCFLGSVVVDQQTNTIFTIFTACSKTCPGNKWTNYITESVDDGKTWSVPRDISSQVGSFQFDGGPSLGVQKQVEPHVGRLVVCGHTEPLSVDGLFCFYSDDHGNTWTVGTPVLGIPYNQNKVDGDYLPDEAALVELPDGTIMVNARNQYHFHCNCRITLLSHDGAQTFPTQDVRVNEDLPDEACAAGLAMFDNKTILFTNPDSTTSRVDMTLRWSTNLGETWKNSLLIFPGYSAYSSVATNYVYQNGNEKNEDSKVYIVYERRMENSDGKRKKFLEEEIPYTIQLAVVDMYGQLN